jgi:hypothetical protein
MVRYNTKQIGTSVMGWFSMYGQMLCKYIIFDISKGKDIFKFLFIYLEGRDILAFFFFH